MSLLPTLSWYVTTHTHTCSPPSFERLGLGFGNLFFSTVVVVIVVVI
jgi:hypothetical protein